MKPQLKISSFTDDVESPFETRATFALASMSAGKQRIVANVPDGDASLLSALVKGNEEPFLVLYVLHTPRGEGEPGRYQSPSMSAEELQGFINRFREYLAADARFDLWIHSPSSQATIVWDRHNQLFAYGPLGTYAEIFRTLGFSEQAVPRPGPHIHHYRAEFDGQAAALLASMQWSHTPLRPEDEQ